MFFSGNQLRAARALLGLDQEAFAEVTGVNINTIRTMEACGSEPVGGFASTRNRVREALERQGIEFFDGDAPGVRLRKGFASGGAAPASASKRSARTQEAPRKSPRPKRR
jgi:transcriptional regulator with XRE-family HTH domain